MAQDSKPAKPTAKTPTMADIARIAGVSASTVSRALAGLPPITEETRQRVARAAREAGYQINRHARSLRLQRSGVLLVLIPNLTNPNFPDLLMHIDRAAYNNGYDIMIAHTGIDPARSDRFVDELFSGGVDGILLTSNYCPPRLVERLAAGEQFPIVRTLSPSEAGGGIMGVQIDEVQAGYDVVSHLVGAGFRRIAHLGGPPDEIVAKARKQGWRKALETHGLEWSPALFLDGGFLVEDGRRAARRLLQTADRPDAVFCSNDESAYGLIMELKAGGLRVPGDIAVAGFDDLSFSSVLDPTLTTVRLPRREMAEVSVRLLKGLIEGTEEIGIHVLDHELIVRDSTRYIHG